MSKKAINAAMKNVAYAGAAAQRANTQEKKDDYYSEVKANADALSLLGIMKWIDAFDMLFAEYNSAMREEKEMNEFIKLELDKIKE